MNVKNHLFLAILFILTSALVVVIGQHYKEQQAQHSIIQQYSLLTVTVKKQIQTLIEEKKNATLSIAVALSQSDQLQKLLTSPKPSNQNLKNFAGHLKQTSDFKNVWVQAVNDQGVSIARSWTDRVGDNLGKIRQDVRDMLAQPRAISTISVGFYDMTFKSMVPVFDQYNKFIGFVEIITHFNSIAEKLKQDGYKPVILVNDRFFQQISRPFTQKFADRHYVANLNADNDLIQYIAETGLATFINPDTHFKIDPKKEYLVINHSLYDTEDRPMANFLVFKKLDDINHEAIYIKATNTNLIIALTIFTIGIFLYLIAEKNPQKIHFRNRQFLMIFGIIFITLVSIAGYLTYLAYLQEKKAHQRTHEQQFVKNFEIINRKYQAISDTVLKLIIHKPEIIALMAQAYGNDTQKNHVRKTLYKLLSQNYHELQNSNLRQLHFHLKDNESFLRFHRPQKYGDDLSEVRSTVAFTNRTHKSITGFEEGRIFSGFRNVYPISKPPYKNLPGEHLGSVEISYSPYALAQDFNSLYLMRSGFMIKKSVVDQKVFESEKSNYQPCKVPGYYFDKHTQEALESTNSCVVLDEMFKKQLDTITKKIDEGKVFSLESDNQSTLFTFIPIHNPVTREVVATFVFQQKNQALNAIKTLYQIWFTVSIVFILLILLYLFKEITNGQRFRLLSEKTQQILDAQKSIVIVTDGNHIIDANETFLAFFNCSNLDVFKTQHDCICDLFEKNDRVFHLDKIEDEHKWIEHLLTLPHKERLVSMKDNEGRSHIFAIGINPFDTGKHILTFSDISDTMNEHFSLETRATKDSLTGAYNRDYFAHHIQTYEEMAQSKQRKLAFILFDIDHFKEINDTYGHNTGDQILQELVKITKLAIRAEDLLIRWGGEEFLIIVEVANLDQALFIAENIRARIEQYRFSASLSLTCSFGVCLHPEQRTYKQSIEYTDQALYNAKKQGRNRVCRCDA